jgi:hypothetical protein
MEKVAKILGEFRHFLKKKNCPQQTVIQQAKIRPIRSPFSEPS